MPKQTSAEVRQRVIVNTDNDKTHPTANTELWLCHGDITGRILIKDLLGGKTVLIAKGDAVALRDALDDWINK